MTEKSDSERLARLEADLGHIASTLAALAPKVDSLLSMQSNIDAIKHLVEERIMLTKQLMERNAQLSDRIADIQSEIKVAKSVGYVVWILATSGIATALVKVFHLAGVS